ncbi:MAG: insulinase family protein [Alistipes sp.]|nr:insulinase family protein [Alistipes sp.]
MKRLFLLVVALVLGATAAVQAQIDPQQPIPADKAIRQGVLPNGLTYYIRHNEKPKGMANFYIVHDVGAVQEADNQQGLAHFLEHMAFNGTKNYPGKSMIEYLEKIGVKFGANLNAFTSWDLTQYYMTDVPVARESVIDSTLLILHDWSHFIALEEKEIDSERGVIKEELRTRDGASWRSTIEMLKAVGKGTIYAERNLIGYLEGLESFTYDDIRDFYHKWYRPDYQAVVVVGDIDVDAVEHKIKTIMADIPAPAADAAKKEVVVIPDNEEPIVSIFTDPEQQRSLIQLIYKQPALPKEYKSTVMAEMIDIVSAYISVMINERLSDIARKPDAPFTGASFSVASSFGICPTLDANIAGVMTPDGKLKEGYAAMLTEMERMRRYGFTSGEYERAKENLLSSIETQYNSREDRKHGHFADRCIDNFRLGTPIPDADVEHDLDKQLTELISLDMINATVKQLYNPLKNAVIIVQSPEKDGVAVPTEQELVDMLKAAVAADVAPFEDNVVKEPLIGEDVVLKGSPVKKESVNATLGTTEWTLKNGIKVIIKQTPYEADRVSLSAESDGGAALFGEDLYYSSQMLGSVMGMSGLSKFSASDLNKQLSGKQASSAVGVGNYLHQVAGSSSLKDVETMFQLVYLSFTAPRFSEDDFATLMKRYDTMLANQLSNPDFIFSQQMMGSLYGNDFHRQQLTPELLKTIKLEDMAGIHSKLFSNAADFSFRIIGNMSPEELKPLVEKYIGSLPAKKKANNVFTDDGVRIAKGNVVNDFRTKMEQPKVRVFFAYSGDEEYTIKNMMTMTYFSQALDNRYLKSIREEKGGTYGVSVRGSVNVKPVESYLLQVAFDTNEQMADELSEIVVAEIKKIAEEGPLAEDMDKTREFLLKNYKKIIEQNSWWRTAIDQWYDYEMDYITEYAPAIEAVTADDVKAMAAKILADGNLVKVVMRPEQAE